LSGKNNSNPEEIDREFWNIIGNIEELDIEAGLSRADGRKDLYKKTLKLLFQEIVKSSKNLTAFLDANDMHNFCIEAHGIKGSLTNIGALKLSAKALSLESASGKTDTAFCSEKLPVFLLELGALNNKLKEAFSTINQNGGPLVIEKELSIVLKQISSAMEKNDFLRIESLLTVLDTYNPEGALGEEVEQIKDAVTVMEYNTAERIIQKLLSLKSDENPL